MAFDPNKPFDEQYPAMKGTLVGYLSRHFKNQIDAEKLDEIADITITKAFAEGKYDPTRGALPTFLITVALNEARSYVRSSEFKKEEHFKVQEDMVMEDGPQFVSKTGNPETPLLKKFFYNRFYAALKVLTAEERKVLIMTIGMKIDDSKIASLLNKKENAIQKMRCIAKEKLYNEMKKFVELASIPENISFDLTQEEFFSLSGFSLGKETNILKDLFFNEMPEIKVCTKHKISQKKLREIVSSAMTSLAAAEIKRSKKKTSSDTDKFEALLSSLFSLRFYGKLKK